MTGARTAIVFDDQAEIADLVVARLAQVGIAAERTSDRTSFLLAVDSLRPDLIFLDLSLGDTDAIEVLGQLHETRFEGQVILMSGHDESILRHTARLGEGLGIAMAGVMRKPFRAETLWSLVANLQPPSAPVTVAADRAGDASLARDAIANGWLEFWYQPKVDLATDLTTGAEVLARVRHPERGIVSPAVFLPGASDEDMMALTLQALESACATADLMLTQGRAMAFAVNIAGRTIAEPRLFNDIKKIRGRHASRLPIVLELTETDVLEDQVMAQAFATRAILNGCQVSVDDFGHGYATFDRLRDMPFNELKLDRSIVKGCAADTASRALCRAGIEIARGFNARIVAEGVENAEDLAVVRSLGFDLAQGYFYSPPVPIETFLRLPFDSLAGAGAAPS